MPARCRGHRQRQRAPPAQPSARRRRELSRGLGVGNQAHRGHQGPSAIEQIQFRVAPHQRLQVAGRARASSPEDAQARGMVIRTAAPPDAPSPPRATGRSGTARKGAGVGVRAASTGSGSGLGPTVRSTMTSAKVREAANAKLPQPNPRRRGAAAGKVVASVAVDASIAAPPRAAPRDLSAALTSW